MYNPIALNVQLEATKNGLLDNEPSDAMMGTFVQMRWKVEERRKEKRRRLVMEVSQDLHHIIKTRSLKKKLTIREWVLLAVAEKINREMIEEI